MRLDQYKKCCRADIKQEGKVKFGINLSYKALTIHTYEARMIVITLRGK